jgi:hypothetical protein
MIGQYLSNTNKSATMLILQKNLELNKAFILHACVQTFDEIGCKLLEEKLNKA